jgi:hypothetical protein
VRPIAVNDGAALAVDGVIGKEMPNMLRNTIQVARSVAVASLALFLSGPVFAGPSATSAAPSNVEAVLPVQRTPAAPAVPQTSRATTTSDAQHYASREVNARPLETFRGGYGGVYIGSGALVAALLIVLIVVLI